MIVWVAPPGSGKSLIGWSRMLAGKRVFEVDWLYATFHNDLKCDGKCQEDWDFVFTKFKELFSTGYLNPFDLIISGDERVAEYLLERGWKRRSMSKVKLSQDTEAVSE
jgi:hypothetical protein